MNKKHYHIFLMILLILILSIINVSAKEITFSVDQKDYYFKVGENAIIPLTIENSYDKQINGMLSYTYTQEVNQQGMHFSSSNTKSISFSVNKDKTQTSLNFGSSNSPSDIKVDLSFSYTDKEPMVVNLNGINIHFVSDDSQKNNKKNQQKSSSQKSSSQQTNQNSQNPINKMKEQMSKMFQNSPKQTSTQQKLQNNQMGQDSSALKKEMQRQMQEQEKMKQEFQKQLTKNPEFQKQHESLTKQGYKLDSESLNPSSNNTGNFEMNYKNKNGDIATLKGEMENGKMKNLQSLTKEDKENIMKQLQKNKNFQKYDKELKNNDFNQKNSQFSLGENKTHVELSYKNPENKTAKISADVINGKIKNVQVEKPDDSKDKNYFWYWFVFFFLLFFIVSYILLKRYYKKDNKKIEPSISKIEIENPFDYVSESKKLLEKSKELFKEGKFKDAYEKAGQSLRLYLSYKYGLKKEITNDEIINHLKNLKKASKNENSKKIKECFDLCSLVEFAKYKANKKDFNKIIEYISKVLGFESTP